MSMVTGITTGIIMATPMTDPTSAHLPLMMTWFSPSFPVGAFSYSQGLEWAVETGAVTSRETLERWVTDTLTDGAGWNDAVLLAAAHKTFSDRASANRVDLDAINTLAIALQPSKERELETTAQGRAFLETTTAVWPTGGVSMDFPVAYPVAVGAVSAAHGIPLPVVLPAYLHGLLANLVSAGVRLVPLGQTDGQRVTASLLAPVDALAARAADATLDDLGNGCFAADIASMNHENQYTRLFRS
ncbi:MAG: urease accessory protein UreF [Pseudomonadota bacterium]